MSRIGGSVLVVVLALGGLTLASPHAVAAVTDVSVVWTRDLPGATVRESSPTLADLDADGPLELLFGSHDSKVWAVHGSTGQTVAGWPQAVTDKVNSSVAAADVDGDGRVELFVGAGTAEAEGGALYSFQHDGTQRFRLQAADKVFAAPAVHSTPAIGDVDGTADANVSFGTLGLLSAWSVSSNGNVKGGCGVDVEYPTGACWPYYTDDTVFSSPALADANGDGIDDVIIGADSSPGAPVDHQGGVMRALNHDRTAIWEVRINDIIRSSPSVGDIDGDGKLEVVFGSGDYWGGTDSTKVFAVNIENGSAVAGWPQSTDGVTNASPTLADLDGDGELDVDIGSFCSAHNRGGGGSVYAWHGNGTPMSGYPTASDGGVVLGQIVTADLRGDGGQDLIVTTGALITALDGATGQHLFHLAEGNNVGFQNSAVVTDVEGDGRLDLFAVGTVNTPAGDGRVYRWSLPAEARLGELGWHEFRRDQHKTGSWASGLAATSVVAPSTRIAGADRFATAASMSQTRSPDGVTTAYVATGAAFADALAGGPAADQSGATVLLTGKDSVPTATRAELSRLSPDEVVVLGGPGAVSDAVVRQLGARRIAGANRYATAAAISADTFGPTVPVVYVATGERFPDALAGAAAGAFENGPVLLVTKDAIPSETDAELRRLLPQRIVILGGTAAVSAGVQSSLALYTLPGQVCRVAGADRYATSEQVSKATFPDGADRVYLATGRNFPDALAGGPVAANGPGPLLLVPGGCMPESVRVEVERLDPDRVFLLGGTGALSGALSSFQGC
jgi:putative cell wall-binding protein